MKLTIIILILLTASCHDKKLQTMKLEIMDVTIYRDGGTRKITTNIRMFWLDHKIGSETKGKLLYSYPSDTAKIVTDKSILKPMKKKLAKLDILVNW